MRRQMVTDQSTVMGRALLSKEDIQGLDSILKELKSIEVEILKVPELGYSKWRKDEKEGWIGDVNFGAAMTEREKGRVEEIRREGVQQVVEIS